MFRYETKNDLFFKIEEGNWVLVGGVQAVAVRPSGKTGIYLKSGIILTTDMTPEEVMNRMAYAVKNGAEE